MTVKSIDICWGSAQLHIRNFSSSSRDTFNFLITRKEAFPLLHWIIDLPCLCVSTTPVFLLVLQKVEMWVVIGHRSSSFDNSPVATRGPKAHFQETAQTLQISQVSSPDHKKV